MAKLYFRYGAMGSSKSANILMVRYNYEERGQYAVLLKPRTDNRDGEHEIKSRIGLEAPAEYVDEFLKEISENNIALYLVAEIAGQIVGYAGMWLIIDEGHITNVAVHPNFRRRHIGEAIVSVLLAEAQAEGITRQTLEVRVSNFAAQRLYEKFGFQACGIRKGYYEDNHEDAIIMWRENE